MTTGSDMKFFIKLLVEFWIERLPLGLDPHQPVQVYDTFVLEFCWARH